jgi:hypothetical protein
MSHPSGEAVMLLRTQYRALVIEWHEARDEPKRANKIFEAHHRLYKQLRESNEGREAIIGLLDDETTAVRVMAATHSLAWVPDRAQLVLEEIERENSLYGTDAKYTLRSYRAGNLNLDW